MSRYFYLACGLTAAIGCTSVPVGDDVGTVDSETVSEADRALLMFANDRFTTNVVLDEVCGLYRNAAANIVGRRDGTDGLPNTADDLPFRTVAELDGVSEVGPAAMARLRACTTARGYTGQGLAMSADWIARVTAAADDGLIAAYAESVCETTAAAVPACVAPCVAGVTTDGQKWLADTVSGWIGEWFAGGGAMVDAAAASLEVALTDATDYWVDPNGSARNQFVGCVESL